MKKLLFTFGASTLLLAACSDSSETAGLGDSYEDFVSAYGENNNDESLSVASFQDDYILSVFLDDEVAFNITLQFEATEDYPRTMDDTLESLSSFIPTDAEKKNEETVDHGDYSSEIIRYTSESLAKDLEEAGIEPFDGDESNQFTVILTESMDKDGYLGATIAIGHENP